MTRAVAAAQLLFGLLVVAAAAALLADAARLPPPRFDILGSAAVPRALCLAVILMALPLLVQAVLALRRSETDASPRATEEKKEKEEEKEEERLPPGRPVLAAAAFALACLYTAVLQNGWLGYGPATAVFLVLLTGLLARGRRRPLAIGAVLAAILGFGGDHVFTSIFLIDLP